MKNRQLRKIIYGMLGFTLVISLGFVSYATRADEIDRTQDEIDKTQDEIDRTQDEIDKTQQEIDATKNKQQKLEQAKAGMEAYLKDLNNQYASIGEQIEDLNLQIKEKEQEIEKTQAELEEAKRVEQQQYKDMKTRIQYMYENSQDNFLTILLEEGSFAAALNKANYAVSIAAYDRQMMENYVAQKEAIEDKEAELQGQKEALDELHASVVKKQEEVSALAKSTSGKIGQHVNAIAAAQADLEGKNDTLEGQKELLADLIAEKKKLEAALEAAKLAEINASLGDVTGVQTSGTDNVQYGAYGASEDEVTALAVLIHCEAANQGDAGRLAVGAVVMNRIRDPRFPQGDIMSVIRAPGQFSPVTSGRFDLVLSQDLGSVSSACYDAARRAIAGESNVGNRVFFRTHRNNPALSGLIIGDHIFSYTWNYAPEE
ncbi:MAG: hypothetical protein HFI26_00640 [Lachnospiraceae bacterium]|jgi:peptidoglycan hydrolase CwlO-like protein|nr:hypothetical protein [Lachnospiraceae bacterium]